MTSAHRSDERGSGHAPKQRKIGDRVFSVFDELERWEASAVPTLEVAVSASAQQDCEALADIFDAAGFAAQDWSSSVRMLCRQCSAGQPFGDHDHPPQVLGREPRFGIAAPEADAARLLAQWSAESPGARSHSAPIMVG